MTPSEMLSVDESISRWYGLGGSWSETGPSHWVGFDTKPINIYEIQSIACGRSRIILRLEIVTGKDDDRLRALEDEMGIGTAVLKRLLNPWTNTKRDVCADSHFSLVENP